MKILNYKWLFLSIVALVAILGSACSSEEKGTLILIEQDWDGQIVTTAVARRRHQAQTMSYYNIKTNELMIYFFSCFK